MSTGSRRLAAVGGEGGCQGTAGDCWHSRGCGGRWTQGWRHAHIHSGHDAMDGGAIRPVWP